MAVKVPRRFVEDFALFAADRKSNHGWTGDDVEEYREYIKERFGAGDGDSVVEFVSREADVIRERMQMVCAMVERIKRRIAAEREG